MVQELGLTLLYGAAFYFIGINLIYGVMMVFSWLKIRRFKKQEENYVPGEIPAVTFIVPAYNEETLIVETIQTYLSLPQEKKEVIVIDDGSHDKTMNLLRIMFQLKKIDHPWAKIYQSISFPNLKVIEATHLGKAGALNMGVRFASFELICTMDADTIPTAHGVEACLRSFAQDKKLIACGGVMHVLSSNELKDNSPFKDRASSWLTSFQRLEYLRTFVCERLGWSYLGSTILISGAFCMLKKDAIQKIGGFSPRSITEDFDLIVRLRRTFSGKDHHIRILPVTTCYTQVPRTVKHLSKQRMRWQMGLIQTLFQNGSLFMHPRHGMMGLITIPYFWLVEALSPFVALVSYVLVPLLWMEGIVQLETISIYFAAGILFNLFVTIMGIHLDHKYVSRKKHWSIARSTLETILIHFGYKQINLFWRLLASMKAFTKAPSWGEKPRVEIIHLN